MVLHSDSAHAIVFLDEVSGIPGTGSRIPGSSTYPFLEEPRQGRPESRTRGSDEIRRPLTDDEEKMRQEKMRPRRTTSTSALDICLQHSSTSAETVRSNISNMSKVDFCPKVDALEDALTKHPRVVAVTRYNAMRCKSSKKDVDPMTEWEMEVCVPKKSSSKSKN
jgi:hypothetical protein